MILEENEILEILQEPRNKNISEWKKQHAVMDIYFNGGDVTSELEKVTNFESEEKKQLRDKVARSTKDLVSYLLNPLSKIFTASGFVTDIEASNKKIKQEYIDYLSDLPEGVSMTKWMRDYWTEAFVTDPNSILFIESNQEEQSYPTYKSINIIHDYTEKWGELDYLVLFHKEVIQDNKKIKVYRVFDEAKDALYYVEKNILYPYEDEEEEHVVNHNNGFVPGVIVSNIVDKKTKGKLSFLHKIDELLKEYLRDSSVHSIYKLLHGFAIFWAYATKCSTCEGTGRVKDPQDETKDMQCPSCKGKRLSVTKDVSDGIRLPLPKDGQQKITPDIAGYVSPDLETWDKQLEEMQKMKEEMYYAIWGTYVVEHTSREKTATESRINLQPINDVLKEVSETVEKKDTMLCDYMAKLMYGEQIKKVSRKYGKRFLIETPDVLWQKYIEAKEKQSPISTLDYLYKRFLMGEYHNDDAMLDQKLKEFYLEPFPHYSIETLSGVASDQQIQRKLLYADWRAYGVDFEKKYEVLKKEFDKYFKDNYNEKVTEVPSTV